MSAPFFVRQDLVPERPAPVKTTGFIGFLRTRLFNTPTNILITILGVLLLWFTVGPAIKFMLIDAVWTGKDRDACLAEKVGRPVGACWPFVTAKFSQFIYGFYPEPERWRAWGERIHWWLERYDGTDGAPRIVGEADAWLDSSR